MSGTQIYRVSLGLASTFLFLTAPSLQAQGPAQGNQWEKHIKAGDKAYGSGMQEKYIQGWGEARPSPQFAKAEEQYLAALAQTQSFPAGDSRTAETLGDLASVYSEEGKFTDAEDRGNQSISVLEMALQPNDPRLGRGLMGLAVIYDAASMPEQAAPLWDRALAILEKAGASDPAMLKQLDFAASMQVHDPGGTEQIYRAIVELRESTGTSDEDLRTALERLAGAQRGPDAEQDYMLILGIDKRLYSPDNSATGDDLAKIGGLYADEGKYAAALPVLQRSLEIKQKTAAVSESKLEKSFDVGAVLRLDRNLALAYAETGHYPEAEEVYKQMLSMDEMETGRNKILSNMDLSQDLTSLSRVYCDERRYDEALDAIKRSEIVDGLIVDPKSGNPKYVIWGWITQNHLAEIYREKGDSAAAEPLFQKSLEMLPDMKLGAGHPELAHLLDNYATLLRDAGRYSEAEPFYKRAVDTWAKSRYPEQPDVAAALTNYAALLRKMDRVAEAEPLEERASAIRAKAAVSPAAVN